MTRMNQQHSRFISEASAESSIPECFRRVVAMLPGKVALVGETWQPSYAELDAQTNRIAHGLIRAGVCPGDRVALLMRHDAPLIASALGVLKAGGIVVVMNPTDPPVRLSQILADASPGVLMADASQAPLAESCSQSRPPILVYGPAFDDLPAADLGMEIGSSSLAFLIYTSGSTGLPKGVMKSHGALVHNVYRISTGLGLSEDDRIVLLASLSGGQGVTTTWTALLTGATLCPFPTMERGVTGLAQWLTENRVSVFISAASLFRHFMLTLDEGQIIPGLGLVRLGSEHAVREDYLSFLKHFPPTCRFALALSSSETGNITQNFLQPDTPLPEGRLPVGSAAPGVEVFLRDASGGAPAPGERGELVVRSRYLAHGYWGNEQLTAERFQEDPSEPGVRIFRSGDLGSWTPKGGLLMMGRNDARVKIRGYRIELSEVEAAVAAQPEVRDVVAGVSKHGAGEEKLTAYVIPQAGSGLDGRQLRAALRQVLPSHMVPAIFIFLESFPCTAHGKTDRQALACLGSDRQGQEDGGSPLTETEKVLAAIWADAFEFTEVGGREDFFDLGGDSLIAAVVAARIEAALGVAFDLAAFAEYPTVHQMSQAVDRELATEGGISTGTLAGRGLPPLVRAERGEPLPLSFGQERILRFSQTPESLEGYRVTRVEKITGPLNVAALKGSIEEVVRRHEMLRTTFAEGREGPVQIVHAAGPVALPFTDLASAHDVDQASAVLFAREMSVPFDLATGPLFRLHLVRVGNDEHLMLRMNHHIISDAWSWKIFLQEMMQHYEALSNSRPVVAVAAELPLQYADFAAWQRQWLHEGSQARRDRVVWWRNYLDGMTGQFHLPLRRAEPQVDADFSEGVLTCAPAPGNADRLDQLAREGGATGFMIRLAAFAAQLSMESDTYDFVMGTHVTNRSRVELQGMFGFFANLVALRIRFDPNQSLRQWLSQVRQMVMEVQSRADLPIELLKEDLERLGFSFPELHAIFGISSQMAPIRGESIDVVTLPRKHSAMPWGLTLTIDRWNESKGCQLLIDARVYHPARGRNMVERYAMFLQEIASQPDAALWDLYEKVRGVIPVREDDSALPW
jgi:amino acid adenylation domain-containing protein